MGDWLNELHGENARQISALASFRASPEITKRTHSLRSLVCLSIFIQLRVGDRSFVEFLPCHFYETNPFLEG
jgi:hypothetical protein